MQSAALRYLELTTAQRTPVEELENTVWIADPDLAFRLAKVVGENSNDVLIVGFRDENGFYEKRSVFRKDVQLPSMWYYCEDMCNLSELNDASVLHTVRCRYEAQLIHTYSGLFCVVVNPWRNLPLYTDEIKNIYMDIHEIESGLPPHVYAIAQYAYDGLLSGDNQSILITGESGAGKTENTKRIIEYLATAAKRRTGYACGGHASEMLTAANVLIESFANASTVHNSNSSRLGKFIRMDFDEEHKMKAAQIECYLLEKSRVVSQNLGDRNFHIFYQLLSKTFEKERKKWKGLEASASHYRFLKQGNKTRDSNIDDVSGANETKMAMNVIGFSKEEKEEVFGLVAACILLGEIKFTERSGLDITYVNGSKEAEAACALLGLKTNRFIDAITTPAIKVGDVNIRKSQNLRKTLSSLSSFCKCIYERLFFWILARCNAVLDGCSLTESSRSDKYIGVLDIAGFEIISRNSFEQFCINYTNEKLQQFFNDFMFIKEQTEYISEEIEWNQVNYGNDMQETIELIEKPLGLISLLQEECVVPNGSDTSLLEKLLTHHSSNPVFARAKQSARNHSVAHFSIIHYAGRVDYNIDSWVEKNKDTVERSGLEVLSESSKKLVRDLFPPLDDEMTRSRRHSMCANTVSYVYKEQLLDLLATLNTTHAQFVRCIVPNSDRRPGIIEPHMVLKQLQCNGVLEGIRICRQGYPNRLTFKDFILRYKFIASGFLATSYDRDTAIHLCDVMNIEKDRVQIGKTKVFCRAGVITELENVRRAKLNNILSRLQGYIRWYCAQVDHRFRLKQSEAVVTIQTNIRSFIEVTTWQWNRLFRQVRQLIPLNRDKKKVEELEEEKRLLIAKIKEMEEQLRNTNSLLRLAEAKIKSLKDEKEVCEAGNEELKMELHRHEQVMEIMEKRFDEQHAKVMRIHSCLRDNERKLERIEEEKKELENEVNKWKDKYNIENVKRIGIEHDHEQCESIQQELETKLDKINEEREKETEQYRQFDLKLGEMKKKIEEQSKTIAEQNRSICQLNENLAKKESIVSNEKRNRKKIEAEKSELSAEITRLKEMAAKESVKISTMEETCRDKDRQIRRLQQKIDESNDNMTRNIEELKKIHRESKQELQEKIDELKSTNRRLESENRALKLKADAVSERESSIESDYVGYRSSRMNNRQFSYGSLSSTGSLSSYRSFSHRRTTEPDLRLFHHTDSGIEQMTMSRCSSQSQLANERKIAQLERQLQSAHTDNQIQKREIEVYKSNISQSERDRETLSRKVRTLMSEINTLERSLGEQTERADSLESKYKKVQNDLQNMKNKYENSVRESQSELLELRKNMRLKIDEAIRKNENARSREYDSDQQICDLRDELDDLKRQLERANKQIAQAENLRKSQEKYGETWENQYRIAISELQSLRDENANLKSKIRRQYREVELLTQQSKVGDEVAKLETRFDFQTESQSDSERSDAISDPR